MMLEVLAALVDAYRNWLVAKRRRVVRWLYRPALNRAARRAGFRDAEHLALYAALKATREGVRREILASRAAMKRKLLGHPLPPPRDITAGEMHSFIYQQAAAMGIPAEDVRRELLDKR